jgi:hypothetical protein
MNLKIGAEIRYVVSDMQAHLRSMHQSDIRTVLKEGFVVYSLHAEQTISLSLDEILIEWHAEICYASANSCKMTVSLYTTFTSEIEQEA